MFEDMEHIARASQHLTLMQITFASLDSVVRAAGELGTVYSIYPAVYQGQAVFDLLVAVDGGGVSEVRVALEPI